jgi:hypothetical protein
LADVVVLTEHALQIAVGEEDGARAAVTPKTILLAEVRKIAGNHSVAPRQANRFAVFQPIDVAVARANATGAPQEPETLLDPPLELTTSVYLEVFHRIRRERSKTLEKLVLLLSTFRRWGEYM